MTQKIEQPNTGVAAGTRLTMEEPQRATAVNVPASVELLVERVLALSARDPLELAEMMSTAEARTFAIKAPDLADDDLLARWDSVLEARPGRRVSELEYSAFLRGEA